jgi:opacity protein-like surface antigen
MTPSHWENRTSYETGISQGILARSLGASISWQHSFNENYGAGALFLWNEVDIEEINGNSHSYAYGSFFTTFHAFEYFDLSTVTTVAYVDFDTGFDILALASVTASKQLTDNIGSYVTFSFQDSLIGDPDTDPTYGTWEVGAVYSFTNNLALTVGYQKTVFLNNYSDNTLILNLNWVF